MVILHVNFSQNSSIISVFLIVIKFINIEVFLFQIYNALHNHNWHDFLDAVSTHYPSVSLLQTMTRNETRNDYENYASNYVTSLFHLFSKF